MKKRCFFEALSLKLQSEKGNAAIITISVILVLTALGTVSLLASAMNVRMGGRTLAWSEEYYTLDTMAEKLVQKIEEEVLIPAEKDARTYVMNRLDRVGYDDMRAHLSNPYYAPTITAHEFFNRYYTEIWTYNDGTGWHEYTVLDYESCIEAGSFMGKTIEQISENYANTGRPETDAANAYRADLTQYASELFERIYFHLVARRLEYMHSNDPDFRLGNERIVIGHRNRSEENYDNRIEIDADRCTYRFAVIPDVPEDEVRDFWNNELKPTNGAIALYILARDENVENREVRVKLEVVLPEYDIIEKTIYTPVYGNPIWANALTVRGGISFGGSAGGHAIKIMGDVYASGTSGVTVTNNTTVNIYGNVYTAGNLQATGTGGKLRVWTKDTRPGGILIPYEYKKAIYTDDYEAEDILRREGLSNEELGRVDQGAGNFLHQYHMLYRLDRAYTANQPRGTANMPFVFKDGEDQGNVYCDSLEVSEGVVGAELQVDGNLWTMDDIQMDGERSTIRIGWVRVNDDGKTVADYSYIGLNDESSRDDPNTSSSVINNFPFTSTGGTNSIIELNSNFVVPGVAFYNFFDSPDPADRRNKYYKSVESVTSRTEKPVAIINAYLDSAGNIYYNQEGDEFALMAVNEDEVNIDDQAKAIIRFINSLEGGVYTNIRTRLTEPAGYVAGVALVEKETGGAIVYTRRPNIDETGSVVLANTSENWLAYRELTNSEILFRLHMSKTKMLGRYVSEYNSSAEPIRFGDLVNIGMLSSLDSSEIIYRSGRPGSEPLDIRGTMEGIVYCTGDLTITGSGEFRGAIICEGDVTIAGDVTIRYDENVIRRKLKNSARLREFFSKGQMGQKLFDIEEYSTTSGKRVQVKRYRIAAWKETPRLR